MRSGSGADCSHALEQANTAMDEGRYADAVSVCGEILKNASDNAAAYHIAGRACMFMEKWDKSLAYFEKAVALDSTDAKAYYELGNVSAITNNLAKASIYYRESINIDPSSFDSWFNLGLVQKDSNDPDGAIAAFRKCIAIRDSAEPHFYIGNILCNQKKPKDAVNEYKAAIALNPSFERAFFNLANTYNVLGKYQDAVESYKAAISVKNDYTAAYSNLANLYYNNGKYDEALEMFRKVIALKPEDEAVQHLIDSIEGRTTQTAPRQYVMNVFNYYSKDFDAHLVEKLDYKVPEKLRVVLDKVRADKKFSSAVDLGCGTGLSGAAFADIAEKITGIDIATRMLSIAEEKKIYQNLIEGEIVEVLDSLNEKFDLFIATDVFIYVGALEKLFEAVKKKTGKGAYFVFSTELSEKEDYVLRKTGRYAQSYNYIKKLADANGFKIKVCEATGIRQSAEGKIPGDLYVLKA